LAEAAWAFPIAGLAPGCAAAFTLWAGIALDVPPIAAALLALGAAALLTGALHEDGLADCGDALAAPVDLPRRLEIMRDSRIGAHGALALIISVGLRASALATLGAADMWWAAGLALAAARAAPTPLMRWLPLARADGLAAYAGQPSFLRTGAALVLAAILMAGAGVFGIVAFAVAVAFVAGWALLARRRFGGYTGDVLGASEQLAEIALLLTLAAFL
jgi:adenosylcobinamide-GDP ribazoletransferase